MGNNTFVTIDRKGFTGDVSLSGKDIHDKGCRRYGKGRVCRRDNLNIV